jgi:hypothetical protein
MSASKWRKVATPIIRRVLIEHRFEDTRECRKALREAYPFGLKEHHPYKVWRDEVRRQLNLPRPVKSRVLELFHQPEFPFPEVAT